MNRFPIPAGALALLALLALGGCTKDRTEIVVGLATDLAAPAPLKLVHVDVFRLPDDIPVGTQDFPISGMVSNVYELPGTYGVYSASGSADRVQVRLEALDENSATLVIRTAVFSLVPERTLFVRLGVIAACEGMGDCGGNGLTCIEGRCTSEDIDSSTLPVYTTGMEKEVACAGGTTFVDTSTMQPLTMTGFACPTGVCLEGVCLSPAKPDGGADGGDAGGADGGAGAGRPATLAATYPFDNSFAAEQAGAPALTPVDPLGTSLFQSDVVLAGSRPVWAFSGTATPPTDQAGLTLAPGGLVNPESYSVDLVVKLTAGDGAWRRLIDVQNRQSDDGFYVDPSNNLDIYPVSGSTGAFTTGDFHHVVLTVDGSVSPASVRAYLDGTPQFISSTAEMDLDSDPTDNPTRLIGFFLDNVAAGGQGEWSGGEVALIRLWDGVLTANQVQTLASNPFASVDFK